MTTGSAKGTALTREIRLNGRYQSRAFKRISLGILGLLSFALIGKVNLLAAQPDLLNRLAPEFVRTDLNGHRVDLKALRGKVVLLNFWASWCGPCQVELPRFQSWQRTYGSAGLQVLTISMDDSDAPARSIVRKLHLDVPVVMGDDRLGREYGGILGLPVTFLINRDGTVAQRVEGGADLVSMEGRVRSLLGKH